MADTFWSGFAGAGLFIVSCIVLMVVAFAVGEWWDGYRRKYCDCGSPLVWGATPTKRTNKRTGEIKTTYRNIRVCDRAFTLDSYLRHDHYGWGYGADKATVRIGESETGPAGEPLLVKSNKTDRL